MHFSRFHNDSRGYWFCRDVTDVELKIVDIEYQIAVVTTVLPFLIRSLYIAEYVGSLILAIRISLD